MTNLIRGRTLTSPSPLFETDRNGVAQSAIRATGSSTSFYSAPSGVYFGPQYTFLIWFKINSCVLDSRPLDFGDSSYYNNVFLSFDGLCNLYHGVNVNGVSTSSWASSSALTPGAWCHIGAVG